MLRTLMTLLTLLSIHTARADDPRLAAVKGVYEAVQSAVRDKSLKSHRASFTRTVPAVGPQTLRYRFYTDEQGSIRKATLRYHVAARAEVAESLWFDPKGDLVFHYARVTTYEECEAGQAPVETITESRRYLAGSETLQLKSSTRLARDASAECAEQLVRSDTRPGDPKQDAKATTTLLKRAKAYVTAARSLHEGGSQRAAAATLRHAEP